MLNIVVAPKEQNARAERNAKKVVRFLKLQQAEYSVYFSRSIEDVRANVKQIISSGERDLVVVGDDTALHEVVASVKDLSKVKIGIVPTSKKDDFARYLGAGANPIQAIKDILAGNTESIDLLIVNGQPVVNNVVIGADVEVFHQYSQFKMQNFITNKFAERKYGHAYAGIELSLETKSKTKKETVFSLVVANGGFSKGKPVSPLANVQDGLFNLTYSLASNKHSNKKFLKQTHSGEHVHSDDTRQFWINNLKITSPEKKIKAMIDGKIQNEEELNISILENALKIFKTRS